MYINKLSTVISGSLPALQITHTGLFFLFEFPGGLQHPHLNVKSKGGGGLYEIPSMVGLWIFSGNSTQYHKKLLKHNKCFSFNLEKKLVF